MQKPTVSVLIPTYNGEKHLSSAIESVLYQTFKDFELIVVDDASRDNSPYIVKSYDDNRIRFHRNKINYGFVSNWNRCIRLANGKYITMLHQDDCMLSNNLEKKVNILQKTNYRWVASDCYQINSKGEIIADHWRGHKVAFHLANSSKKEKFDKMFFDWNYLCFPTIMWESLLIREVGLFSNTGGFCTDVYMWLRLLHLVDMFYIPEQLIRYRYSDNLSLTYDDYDWYFDNCLARKAIISELHLSPKYKMLFSLRFTSGFLWKALTSTSFGDYNKAKKMLKGIKILID